MIFDYRGRYQSILFLINPCTASQQIEPSILTLSDFLAGPCNNPLSSKIDFSSLSKILGISEQKFPLSQQLSECRRTISFFILLEKTGIQSPLRNQFLTYISMYSGLGTVFLHKCNFNFSWPT